MWISETTFPLLAYKINKKKQSVSQPYLQMKIIKQAKQKKDETLERVYGRQ